MLTVQRSKVDHTEIMGWIMKHTVLLLGAATD